jgi:hypothetical protein
MAQSKAPFLVSYITLGFNMRLPEKKSEAVPENETGLLLGFVSIMLLVVLLVATLVVGFPSGHFSQDRGTVLMGIYLMVWGVMFLGSYFYDNKSFFFRGLMWVCEHFSSPASRKMAFFYFALGFFGGSVVLLVGLGIV